MGGEVANQPKSYQPVLGKDHEDVEQHKFMSCSAFMTF